MPHESSSNRPIGFESTRWSLVAQVRSGDTWVRQQALDQLLKTYYPALRAHLVRRMGVDVNRAEDLLQGFVVQKILQRDLVSQADRSRGRLRSLLLKSLENYARTELTRDRKHARQSLDDDPQIEAAAATAVTADAFEIAWARSMLVEALCRMWEECQKMGRKHIWALLESRVISPALDRPTVPYEEIIKQYGFKSPQEASNALMTAKRQFKRALRAVVAESVDSEAEIDDEIADLGTILSRAPAGGENLLPRQVVLHSDEESGPILMAIDDSNPQALARLLALPTDRETLWNEDDLTALIRHQMSVPLNLVFASLSGGRGRSSELLPSFGALLTSRFASLEVLDSVKRAARAAIADESVGIPSQIAAVLYFASIALALVRHDERISKSDDTVLRYGFEKMLGQPWLTKALRQLFEAGLRRLGAATEGGV